MDNVAHSNTPRTGGSSPPAPLSPHHEQMLLEESGISAEVVAERGYWTATKRVQLKDLPGYQRRVPALVLPAYSPDTVTTSLQTRPDRPRLRNGKAIKYETPAGGRCILDVHPRNMAAVRDPNITLWVTEGIKKGDSLTTRGCCAVALVGVWNWQRGGEPLPCWDHVTLERRETFVVFDSDVMAKPEVQLALERFSEFLQGRGAGVNIVYLPEVVHAS
jgi:hypothetical protein